MRRLVGLIIRLYPPAWRERYGAELDALVDDVVSQRTLHSFRLVLDLLFGVVRERLRHHPGPPAQVGGPPVFGPDFFPYRDRLYRRVVGKIPSQLLNGETALGALLVLTRFPRLRLFIKSQAIGLAGWQSGNVAFYLQQRDSFAFHIAFAGSWPWIAALLGVVAGGWLFLWLSGSHRRILVISPSGVTLIAVDWLGRPKSVTDRLPPLQPQILRRTRRWDHVRLGTSTFWTSGGEERTVLSWMQALGQPPPGALHITN